MHRVIEMVKEAIGYNQFVVAALHIDVQRKAQICNHLAQTMTKPSSEETAPENTWSTSASLRGSFSHNAPINVCSQATVTVQFVQAIINSGYIFFFLYGSVESQRNMSVRVPFGAEGKIRRQKYTQGARGGGAVYCRCGAIHLNISSGIL